MCEFRILVSQPGEDEVLAIEDISYLELQEDGTILLRGLGVQEKVENAIIKVINTYAEEGATAKLVKSPIIGDFLRLLNKFEQNPHSPEIKGLWSEFVSKGNKLFNDEK
ncbi:MAG: hypothetical protein ACTSQI_05960 [Candidatus Helarchaeota archaeon]